MKITLKIGDITRERADAIVNAANSSLRGGGGVDGAIHRRGGPAIGAECQELRETRYPEGLPTGQAAATTAGHLDARWVIHTVGPVYSAREDRSALLASCYEQALRVADELGAKIVAFPAVSAGIYGWPHADAARIALITVSQSRSQVEEARFVLFTEDMHATFATALASLELTCERGRAGRRTAARAVAGARDGRLLEGTHTLSRRTTVSDRSPRFRPVLDQFVTYQPGRRVAGRGGRSFKLASNESPFGPGRWGAGAIAPGATDVNWYPDNSAEALTEAIARRYRIPPAHVAVGCGSVGMIQQLLAATAEPGAEVLYAWRSFEAYPILVPLTGAADVRVPLRDETHDLAAMADAITPRTRLIFVCNPNNPTGTIVHGAELEEFLDRVPSGCLVVLDEAYADFVRDPAVPDGLELYRDRPNLGVLRTFSKAHGLAGLRIGFLVGHEPVTNAARTTMLPFAVNALAQTAAIASLAAEAELAERVDLVVKERARVRDELLAQGWTVPPTEANFVWLRLGEDTQDFAAVCAGAGISIRAFGDEGARVSVGTQEANDAFLAVARHYPRRH